MASKKRTARSLEPIDAPAGHSRTAYPPKRRPLLLAIAIGMLVVWFAAMVGIAFLSPPA